MCAEQFDLLRDLLATLRDVQSRLPVVTLLSDTVAARAFRGRIAAIGSNPLLRRLVIPSWAKPYHQSSFMKLLALELDFEKVIILDNDILAHHNFDHLADVETPAMCFHPGEGINSGVMVLNTSKERAFGWHRFFRSTMVGPNRVAFHLRPVKQTAKQRWGCTTTCNETYWSDGGDQEVWNLWFRHRGIYELPMAYNFRPHRRTPTLTEHCGVYLLHKLKRRGTIHTARRVRYNCKMSSGFMAKLSRWLGARVL